MWHTSFGPIHIDEAQWRLGRRGKLWRPFCQRGKVEPQGNSLRLQRVLVDFGVEAAFARAAQRVREHYGIEVSVQRVRRQTLLHGACLSVLEMTAPKPAAQCLVSQMDGSMIPVMVPTVAGRDRRKGKTLLWREARLGLAREKNSATPKYGATLGGTAVAGMVWEQTARAAGFAEQTQVHGVGDGAPWIVDQFGQQFGKQGKYLIDFYHVSEYLAGAGGAINPKKAQAWRKRQQGRLLKAQLNPVLRAMKDHLEPPGTEFAPVRAAYRYLEERREHLDYASARAQELPIGSGEIESGHRHVVQARLKQAGMWWKESNAQAMLGARVARANGLWESYWQKLATANN